ncbi:Glycosyl transferase, group 1 family protein [hydrothermal vent metagenome]|uniref:Glycosyl transferase, group 1 family protein n=1 Tax=hydrothermal vent metagenome TaxID=652676 RepID=A0A3B0Z8F3_9ZZZZ
MKILFYTFYYPPDLCAGSFRAVALVESLEKKMGSNDELHIVTTHPNRYASHRVAAKDIEIHGKVTIHRISIPAHKNGFLSQARAFWVYSRLSLQLCRKLKPDFLIGTTSRLMTGVLTWRSARRHKIQYFIDLRDIFSETISDIFAQKSRLFGYVAKAIFSFLDRRVLINAAAVNVVSEGFFDYFRREGICTKYWSFYPNGVDKEFINFPEFSSVGENEVTTILYAGNIGSGQGLEKIVPSAAKILGDKFQFVIIGDGGTKSLLIDELSSQGINNVKLIPPVARAELIEYYQNADILFLQLNDISAFRRVLPSKIFEYAALGKSIVAGLSGYSAKFLEDNVPYAHLFEPGNVNSSVSSIRNALNSDIDRVIIDQFTKKYSRSSIMDRMAKHILVVAGR